MNNRNQTYKLRLSGLEPLLATTESNFINVGERCNVTGSKKFLDLIKENRRKEAERILGLYRDAATFRRMRDGERDTDRDRGRTAPKPKRDRGLDLA